MFEVQVYERYLWNQGGGGKRQIYQVGRPGAEGKGRSMAGGAAGFNSICLFTTLPPCTLAAL